MFDSPIILILGSVPDFLTSILPWFFINFDARAIDFLHFNGFFIGNNHLITDNGKVAKDYNEKDLKEYMKWDSINIEVNLNIGNASYTVYTCDFTHDYIDINADYRN